VSSALWLMHALLLDANARSQMCQDSVRHSVTWAHHISGRYAMDQYFGDQGKVR
jgi:hypothetical protein